MEIYARDNIKLENIKGHELEKDLNCRSASETFAAEVYGKPALEHSNNSRALKTTTERSLEFAERLRAKMRDKLGLPQEIHSLK